MSDWKPKRFWDTANVAPVEGGFAILLDERPVRTPGKTQLIVPTALMAEAIAAEWDAQEAEVDPRTMPMTRSANSAIDKVRPQHREVAGLLSEYGGSDLLCYRAGQPAALAERQAVAWDPILDWAADALDARLVPTVGVMPVEQDATALRTLSTRVHGFTEFQLTGFHDLVGLSGSLILAFSVTERRLDVAQAWDLSRIDEVWQEEQWGYDEEAAERTAKRGAEFAHAAHVFDCA